MYSECKQLSRTDAKSKLKVSIPYQQVVSNTRESIAFSLVTKWNCLVTKTRSAVLKDESCCRYRQMWWIDSSAVDPLSIHRFAVDDRQRCRWLKRMIEQFFDFRTWAPPTCMNLLRISMMSPNPYLRWTHPYINLRIYQNFNFMRFHAGWWCPRFENRKTALSPQRLGVEKSIAPFSKYHLSSNSIMGL